MHLRVQHVLWSEKFVLRDISKSTLVDEIRSKIAAELDIADESTLILVCIGKVLVDGQPLINYHVEDGMTVLVQERMRKEATIEESKSEAGSSGASTSPGDNENELEPGESDYFDVGQLVDTLDDDGSWYEAKIEKIRVANEIEPCEDLETDGLLYYCRYDRYSDQVTPLPLYRVRPRAVKVDLNEIVREAGNGENQIQPRYLVNYNLHVPGELGNWYEADIDFDKMPTKTRVRFLSATVHAGCGDTSRSIPDCRITKLDECYVLPPRRRKLDSTATTSVQGVPPLRTHLDCQFCFDNASSKPSCQYCLCVVCRTDDESDKLLVCEECQETHHTYCLSPPLASVPEDDWYCPACKNDDEIVTIGDTKLLTKRMLNKPAANTERRHWGGGHSCDGVSKKCTIVPPTHRGPIPGVEVGTCWRYRKQVAEAGIHRPLVCGIHGRESEGAYSIVVAGGYDDDKDDGDVIIYTGSGGRDLSGNKRTAPQSKDQELTRFNASLARCCYSAGTTKLSKSGHDAGDKWKKGNGIRVVRSHKLKNEYAPKEGFRYDGIYKVTRYWPEKGKQGFIVWRYELQRDDETPAPWTEKGKKRILKKGLDKMIELADDVENKSDRSGEGKGPKRPRFAAYEITDTTMKLIRDDEKNSALWSDCLAEAANGSAAFFEKVAAVFACAICQDVVYCPVALECGHSLCSGCLSAATKRGLEACPSCRRKIKERSANEQLRMALESLIPGYGKERKN